jgi:hypothetical protein
MITIIAKDGKEVVTTDTLRCRRPYCGGRLASDDIYGPRLICDQCGRPAEHLTIKTIKEAPKMSIEKPILKPVPPKPAGHKPYTVHKYYEEHKTDMLEEMKLTSVRATLDRWGVAFNTRKRLSEKWGFELKKEYIRSGVASPAMIAKKQYDLLVAKYDLLEAEYAGYRKAIIDQANNNDNPKFI